MEKQESSQGRVPWWHWLRESLIALLISVFIIVFL
jgi:hypothetical protein